MREKLSGPMLKCLKLESDSVIINRQAGEISFHEFHNRESLQERVWLMGFEKHVVMQQSDGKKEVQNGHSLNCKKVQCKTGFKRNKMTCMLKPTIQSTPSITMPKYTTHKDCYTHT